jgi:O-antigen/teichoic acid export membrane protein
VLARSSLLILLNNVLGGALGIAGLYFVGHWMGPEPLGRYAYAGAIVGMLGILGDFGIGQAHLKRLSEVDADRGRSIGTFALFQVSLSTLVVLGFLVLLAVAEHAPRLFGSSETWPGRPLLAVILVALLLQQLRAIAVTTLMALRRTAQQEVVLLVEHVVRFPAILAAAWYYAGRSRATAAPELPADSARGALWLAWAALLAVAASVVLAVILFRRNRLELRAPSRELVASYLRFALPIAFAGAVALVASNLDRVVIGRLCDEREVGIYHGATRLLAFLTVIPAAATTLLLPRFSELLSSGESDAASALLAGALRRIWMVVLGALVLCVVFAPEGVRLVLGPDFADSAAVLRCLAPHALVLGVVATCSALLAGSDRAGLVARVALVGAVATIVLDVVLVPRAVGGLQLAGLGARGAAVATSSATALAAICAWAWMRRTGVRLGVAPALARQTAAAVAAAGALVAWKASPLRLPFESAWALGLAAVAGTALFVALLHRLGEFEPSDRRFFRELLDSRLLAQAVSSGLRSAPGTADGRVTRRQARPETNRSTYGGPP